MNITEIIARLGHACGLPWGNDAMGIPQNCPSCGRDEWLSDGHVCVWCEAWVASPTPRQLPPTLAEWSAEWEREHPGERGPVASWTDGRVWWKVVGPSLLRIGAGTVEARLWTEADPGSLTEAGWVLAENEDCENVETADVVELGRLMQAVDGAR
ncbi:MAG: hypothetical protein ACRCZP_19860 [Phycicoccus sp.]